MNETLFALPPVEPKSEKPRPAGRARVLRPNRLQVQLRPTDLESLLPPEHQARVVWAYVEGLELNPLYEKIRSVEGHAGRDATEPTILMALWLYATLQGVGAARAIDRLSTSHDAYRWICGGVSVNYHTLSDFRTKHVEFLDHLLTVGVASLMNEGLVTLNRVAQDGVKVRASAGAASFRRKPTLEECLEEAQEQVDELKKELDEAPSSGSRREKAARERAAREMKERIERALLQMPEVEAKKKSKEKEKARVSTTDPDARVMKMADGGFRPAYNGQFATDTQSQIIVGVEATNAGNDHGQLGPMNEQIHERFGKRPEASLVDGGFVSLEEIEKQAAPELGVTVYAPVPQPKDKTRDPYKPLPEDSPAVAAWRERMGTEEAKEIYKERAATAECVNAIARNRGLQQLRVRGKQEAKAVLLWFALAHNLIRAAALRLAATMAMVQQPA